MDSSESTWCMFVYVCNLGWRTEVASWGTNKALHKHKRFKANLSLGFLKVAVGIKPTTTRWFYQNDRRWTQKLKVMWESLIRGKNKMYRKLTKINKSQSLNTDFHPKQKPQRVKWWCRLPESTRPSEQRNCSTLIKPPSWLMAASWGGRSQVNLIACDYLRPRENPCSHQASLICPQQLISLLVAVAR